MPARSVARSGRRACWPSSAWRWAPARTRSGLPAGSQSSRSAPRNALSWLASPRYTRPQNLIWCSGGGALQVARLPPVVPFALANYAFAITDVSFPVFFIASAVGVTPACIAEAYLGDLCQVLPPFPLQTVAGTAARPRRRGRGAAAQARRHGRRRHCGRSTGIAGSGGTGGAGAWLLTAAC